MEQVTENLEAPKEQNASSSVENSLRFSFSQVGAKGKRYRIQFIGTIITVLCAAYFIKINHKNVFVFFKSFLEDGAWISITMISYFHEVFFTLLTWYFFIKVLLVPSYGAGRNSERKFWQIGIAYYFHSFELVSGIFSQILTKQKDSSIKSFFTNINYYPLVSLFILFTYNSVCTKGDDERFSFIKPWIIEKNVDDEKI